MIEELKKSLKSQIKDEILDIILYGSSVKGKQTQGDIDLAVIFKEGNLRERLNRIQDIKRKIRTNNKVDIKGILLVDLFKEEFFGRSGIIFEGISLRDGKQFCNKIGFENSSLFIYNLKGKSHTEKVKFNYIMSGRYGRGVLEVLEGNQLGPGIVLIPVKNSIEFESLLKKQNISYSKKNILIQR